MEETKIMIVDDEETLATFLAKVLKEDNPNFEIQVKLTGEEALETLPEFVPDLVLLDIRLPKKDGTQVLKEIKEFDRDIQVIIMTGFASLDSAVAALREGAYDYINKPFETSQVKTIVKNAIERRMLLKERETLIADLSEANEKLADANAMLKEKKALADKKLEERIIQLSKLNKISQKINAEVNIDKLIKLIPESTLDLFKTTGSMILFLDENKSNLIVKGNAGDKILSLGEKISAKTAPFDVSITKKTISQIKKIKVGKKEVGPIACTSLQSGGQNIGALCVVSNTELDKDSLQFLNTVSQTASIALENASLVDSLKRSSLEVILSMLLIEGFRDPKLKEHSEMVSTLSEELSKDMKINKEGIKNIKYAALIHDIGKVVLPEKQSDLKNVFEKTFSIIGHVKFLEKPRDIIKHSMDDFSKKGDKIPLLSRIFAVVNSFEELIYSGTKLSDAIKYLENEKGKKFDPKVVDNFKKVLKNLGK